jgi:hypothetical protein
MTGYPACKTGMRLSPTLLGLGATRLGAGAERLAPSEHATDCQRGLEDLALGGHPLFQIMPACSRRVHGNA